jgi:dolichol-phosphate mannosyltransferase
MNEISKKRVVVMIPTYNEAGNIGGLVRAILELPMGADIAVLVADDDSPDGTGRIVEDMTREDGRVHILIRRKRRGRGAGGIDGFKAALALRPDCVVEMDGDFSHQPKFIPDLVEAMKNCDVAIGSRFVKGGKDADRGLHRRLITALVRRFLRRQFRFPVKDVSSGFRCFRKDVLERIDLDDMISVGPSIVLEVLYKVSLQGFRISEVPIEFVDRKQGKTKLNLLILLETLIMAIRIKRQYKPETRGQAE